MGTDRLTWMVHVKSIDVGGKQRICVPLVHGFGA